MPGGHDTTFEVSNIMSFVLYTQILKQSVLKPASPGITLKHVRTTATCRKKIFYQERVLLLLKLLVTIEWFFHKIYTFAIKVNGI